MRTMVGTGKRLAESRGDQGVETAEAQWSDTHAVHGIWIGEL